MNRTKIEYADYTWNPVTGCLHGCEFCYARRIDKRFGDGSFTPTFHPERLQEPLKVKKPSRIFVGSMADLFGDWCWKIEMGGHVTRDYVMDCIFETIEQCPQHTFIFLTKNPRGMQGFDFPDTCWCGTSVESQDKMTERTRELLKVNCKTLWLSLEPLLSGIAFGRLAIINCPACGDGPRWTSNPYPYQCYKCDQMQVIESKISWIVIGAQTGPGAKKPERDWIESIIWQARGAKVPVFVKDNCQWPEAIREYPGVMA
jgi:protein gp37